MVALSLLVAMAVAFLAGPSPVFGAITPSLQSILKNTHGSMDDYWRDEPFYTGLAKGCMSTEADVWLYNDTLYVGHHESALTEDRTLESLYIKPILDILARQNPDSPFITLPTKNGVWDTDPEQTLYFFIDVKTSGHETFEAVIKALEPLREKGYLTSVTNGKTVTNGPVTIIATGETPLEMVTQVPDRDYFFDAPLGELTDKRYADITAAVSPIASTDFEKAVGKVKPDTSPVLTDAQLKSLQSQIAAANERGIGARYWNTPSFPVRKRNLIWRALLQEGVMLLNADDLDAVNAFF
ncbi:hypothetical protein NUU61_002096 [Penicillium alfredii]|uniref:Altered inheritance of mitochondria protein 6 n=1 Tax=Penicillium alfredii TaxID=1506179 RepID=A0A9W9FR26_9EURO|nr:uncharacterized protein NUU61_002096 [Penicillium alfredii]KAJ5104749.1 hypothetical protein NUU61_002096 [Penicillium alfredii]